MPVRALLVILGAMLVPDIVTAQQARAQADIVGTWLLESIVDTLNTGAIALWMGPHPSGAIIYSASGHMSVQFMRDPRPVLALSPNAGADAARMAGARPFEGRSVDELRPLLEGYYAYFGRYEISAAGDSITHFVETSLRPAEVGIAYRRAIRIAGNRLFIDLKVVEEGVPRHRVLTWRRAS